MPVPRPENLKPVKTKEEARKRGRNGGIKSGIAKREKKLLSQIYGEFLAEKHDIVIDGTKQKITGADLVKLVSRKIVLKGDSASVSMLKEIREATEGSKVEHSGSIVSGVLKVPETMTSKDWEDVAKAQQQALTGQNNEIK